MAFPTVEEIRSLVEAPVAAAGLDLEGVTIQPSRSPVVAIVIDADEPPSSDTIEALSSAVSDAFDAAEAAGKADFGDGYTVEVSTPGLSLALTLPRHFRRRRGRTVKVTLHNGTQFDARLGGLATVSEQGYADAADDGDWVMLVRPQGKPGKKLPTLDLPESACVSGVAPRVLLVAREDIRKMVVDVEFSAPSEAELSLAHADPAEFF